MGKRYIMLPKIQSFSNKMKKIYMTPAVQVNEAEVINMMAVSLREGSADAGKEVLTKEDNSWGIWDDSE